MNSGHLSMNVVTPPPTLSSTPHPRPFSPITVPSVPENEDVPKEEHQLAADQKKRQGKSSIKQKRKHRGKKKTVVSSATSSCGPRKLPFTAKNDAMDETFKLTLYSDNDEGRSTWPT